MSIDWSKAPEGATHYCKPHGMWHKAAYNPFRVWVWMQNAQDWELQPKERTDFWLSQGDLSEHNLLERPKKRLTQAVFDGLPPEYRWAAVSRHRGGSAHVFPAEPSSRVEFGDWTFFSDRRSICVGSDYDASDWQNSLIERQEVSNRVEQLRSVEAARKHSHYFKDVSGVDQIDVYAVLRLFEVTDPCLQHIVKKALCAGKRGAKDWAKDVQEIADTAQRLIELESAK